MYIRSLKECPYTRTNRPDSSNPNKFELLVRDCAVVKYRQYRQDFHLYGRSGQKQHGIDIFSDDWKILIQCKAYSATEDNYTKFRNDITECLQRASKHFRRDGKPIFERFIVATTLNTDTGAQDNTWKKEIEDINATADKAEKDTNVKVNVWFWNDLAKTIEDYRIHNDGDRYADEFIETLFLHKDKAGCENVTLKNLFVPQKYSEWNGFKFGDPQDKLEARIKRFCSSDDDRKLLIIEGDAGSGKSTLSAMLCHNAQDTTQRRYGVFQRHGDWYLFRWFRFQKSQYKSSKPLPSGNEARSSFTRKPVTSFIKHCRKNDNPANMSSPPSCPDDLLNGRPLLAIQLRKLIGAGDLAQNLKETILSYLNIRDQDEMDDHFPNAVFLLDGFDELCMQMNGTFGCEKIIKTLCEWLPKDSKLILTSRPKYIDIQHLGKLPFSTISLQHFGREKRQKWLDKYSAIFPGDSEAVNKDVAKFILSSNDQNDPEYNLCDTPLMMYLLIGGKVTLEQTKNKWVLYHYLFSEAVVDTPHSKQWGVRSLTEHPMTPEIGELLYRITEEIAYKMYSAGAEDPASNDLFVASSEAVQEVIVELLKDEHFRNDAIQAGLENPTTQNFDLKRLHALCCYWRSNAADGPVEFYHNNIRDFFLCEKIRRELNTLYENLYKREMTDEERAEEIAKLMVDLFKYGELDLEPKGNSLLFLQEYARYAADEQKKQRGTSPTREQEQRDVFFLKEQSHHLLPTLYQKMLTEGSLFDNLGMKDHVGAIRNIMKNTALVYHRIYEYILEDGERINWWNGRDVKDVNQSGIMRYVFLSFVKEIGARSDLYYANLNKADFSAANLNGANFNEAQLNGVDLTMAYLSESHLERAELNEAHLERVELVGADLREAHLEGAYLSRARLSKVHLCAAHLNGANLRWVNLVGANLIGAELTGTDFTMAVLTGADLTGADLRNATLPDGFKSDDQDEQIAHLKSLNIPGLII